jgi:hypothetical protein
MADFARIVATPQFDFTYLEQSACDGYKKGVSSKRVGEIATGRGGNLNAAVE